MGPRRDEDPNGGLYHVYARGNNGQDIYGDDADRVLYLRTLADVVQRTGWWCLAYCLMTNHLHLIVETVRGDLGRGMDLLHGRYGRAFNRRHGRAGHVFQGRYGAKRIVDDGHLCMTVRYVALNPVEAGLCARPEDWRWSSCGHTLDGSGPAWIARGRLLTRFAWLGGDPAERYAEMVEPA